MNESTQQDLAGDYLSAASIGSTHTTPNRMQRSTIGLLAFCRTPLVWMTLSAATLVTSWPVGSYLLSVHRVQRAEHWLAMNGADVRWSSDLRAPQWQSYLPFAQTAFDDLGCFWGDTPAVVELAHGDLNDKDLSGLALLTDVTTLRLRSNEATDTSLEVIAQLPKLKRLVLAGSQFTSAGLQRLRDMNSLKSLVLCDMSLSDSELALLESSIPDVDLVYYGSRTSPVYRRLVHARLAVDGSGFASDGYAEPAADVLFGPNSDAERARSQTTQMSAEIQS
ncbi:MAG: hypothetical protein U0892_14750 [Pirellulales bacterium]